MEYFNFNGLSKKHLKIVREQSKILFHFSESDDFVFQIGFENTDDIDRLFNWLLAAGKNKVKLTRKPEPNSVKMGSFYVVKNPDFQVIGTVYQQLIPNYKAHYIEPLKPDKFIKFTNSQELNEQFSNYSSINYQLEQGYINFKLDGQEVTILLSPDRFLSVDLTAFKDELPHYSERFALQLSQSLTNKQIIDFIKHYLTNTTFRYSEIQKNLDSFMVLMTQERNEPDEN